jgi:hypothetical protein
VCTSWGSSNPEHVSANPPYHPQNRSCPRIDRLYTPHTRSQPNPTGSASRTASFQLSSSAALGHCQPGFKREYTSWAFSSVRRGVDEEQGDDAGHREHVKEIMSGNHEITSRNATGLNFGGFDRWLDHRWMKGCRPRRSASCCGEGTTWKRGS